MKYLDFELGVADRLKELCEIVGWPAESVTEQPRLSDVADRPPRL
jgi:hypothetical protein